MRAPSGTVETSPFVVSLFIVVFLLFVCVATTWALWHDDRRYRDEKRARERLRDEVNKRVNDEETRR